MKPHVSVTHAWLATLIALTWLAPSIQADEVNVYSARQESLIKPLLDRYTDETGIEVNLVTGKGDALLTRLQNEGLNSPADVLITVDAGASLQSATSRCSSQYRYQGDQGKHSKSPAQ